MSGNLDHVCEKATSYKMLGWLAFNGGQSLFLFVFLLLVPMVGDKLRMATTVKVKIGLYCTGDQLPRTGLTKLSHQNVRNFQDGLTSLMHGILYQAGFSLFHSFIDTAGYVKGNCAVIVYLSFTRIEDDHCVVSSQRFGRVRSN